MPQRRIVDRAGPRATERVTALCLLFLVSALLSRFPLTAAAATGLIGYWKLNETSGTTASDASGNGRTGTLLNGPVWTTAGQRAGGLVFDGINDAVDLGNPVAFQLTGSLTVSAWIKSSASPVDDAAIVSKRASTNAGFQLDTTIDKGPRTIGFKLSGSAGDFKRYGATPLALNTWYHVAGVYDATARTLHVYLNGQLNDGTLVGTVPTAQTTSTLNVQLGQRPGLPGTYNFAGTLDEVRLYPRALSQAEIQADMNAGP